MNQFKYTLPSGANFTLQTSAETTPPQADFIFYSQVAAGALTGFVPGQSISGDSINDIRFDLGRLDRGTAGVNDRVILAIINGLPTVTTNLPELIDTPLENPITSADLAEIASSGFTAPAIGSLTSNQTQAIMAQVANSVGQDPTEMTNDKGVGQYGLSCQQLEMAGYVKPGTWQQFLQNGSSTLTDVLDAPGIWTGLGGVNNASDFLNNNAIQHTAQSRLMTQGYNSLQAAGVIETPAAQSISAVQGVVYTGATTPLVTATSILTDGVNSQIGSLVANSSRFGTQLTSQWAQGLPSLTSLTSNLTSIKGIGSLANLSAFPSIGSLTSGITPNLASVQTAMNSLGKASQFATTAASSLTSGIGNLSNFNVTSLTAGLPSASALTGQATALAGQLQGQATALLGQAQGQITSLAGNFSNINVSNLLGGTGDSLVASVQKAAGFSNTVNRATVDVAMTKIFGSSKIPVPSLGSAVPDAASIGAALDIAKAQTVLKDLQGQGNRLLGTVQTALGSSLGGLTSQVTTLTRSATTVFNPGAGTLV
jgi:hypothetical protein